MIVFFSQLVAYRELKHVRNSNYWPLRYKNGKIMGVGHDWAEENADLTWVNGLTKVDTFHIAPDKGMAIYFFKSTEQAKQSLPRLKEFFAGYSEMFECRVNFELGAFNATLSEKLTSQASG